MLLKSWNLIILKLQMQKEKLEGCCLFKKRNVMFKLNGRMQIIYVIPFMMMITKNNGKSIDVIGF